MSTEKPPSEGGPWSDLHEAVHQSLLSQMRANGDEAGARQAEANAAPIRGREVVRRAARIVSITVEDCPE